MNILLDDLAYNSTLYPFGVLKSIAHIRVGILTIIERWELAMKGKVFLTSQRNEVDTGLKKFPVNLIPSINFLKQLKNTLTPPSTGDCKFLEYPWHIFEYNDWAIREDFKMITEGKISAAIASGNTAINPGNIFIEENASINHSILNAADGPIYIGKNSEILEGSLIRGPFALCEGGRVKMGAKIYGGTTIGPYCVASGEIKNSILTGYSNKAHDGYLGDSVIGEWCNLGAGTSNSNLKNTAGIIKMWSKNKDAFVEAGYKCGLVMGDYSRCAINTSFNTGTIAGICCNIFGKSFPPKFIEDFTWGNEKYIFEKAISDINNWKKLKGFEITEEEIISLKKIYELKQKE